MPTLILLMLWLGRSADRLWLELDDGDRFFLGFLTFTAGKCWL